MTRHRAKKLSHMHWGHAYVGLLRSSVEFLTKRRVVLALRTMIMRTRWAHANVSLKYWSWKLERSGQREFIEECAEWKSNFVWEAGRECTDEEWSAFFQRHKARRLHKYPDYLEAAEHDRHIMIENAERGLDGGPGPREGPTPPFVVRILALIVCMILTLSSVWALWKLCLILASLPYRFSLPFLGLASLELAMRA